MPEDQTKRKPTEAMHASGPMVPWKFSRIDRVPCGQSAYPYAMDMQVWQYRNGLRIFCLHCIANTKGVRECRCKLVDVRGKLVYPGDVIMFPHSIDNDKYYRCLTRRHSRPKACDLRIFAPEPVNQSDRTIDRSITLRCSRARCRQERILAEGLESFRKKSVYWEWAVNMHQGITRCHKWIKVASLAKDIAPFVPGLRHRIRLLKQSRKAILTEANRQLIWIDHCLMNLYGIATLLAMRQACRAWRGGVTMSQLSETLT